MRIKAWGVRGSTPTPQPENLRYGGNTPCVEIRSADGRLLIVDCGSGLRMLGKALVKEFGSQPIQAHILISHYHWDHIQGLPFFAPLYAARNQFYFYSFHLPRASVEAALQGQMADPYFPVDMNAMFAERTFSEIGEEKLAIDDFLVQGRWVNHPQGCLAFRIENEGKAVVYASDNEPGIRAQDQGLRELARDADVLIYDSQYSQAELKGNKKGWGHSSWEEGVKLCQEADVKELVLFHHDPDASDADIDAVEAAARARFPHCRAAYEVMEILL